MIQRLLHVLFAGLLLSSCALPGREAILASPDQPVQLAGELAYSNDIFLTYHETHAVALMDMHGFVLRDPDWQLPLDSVVFGRLEIDSSQQTASYTLDLPLQPDAEISDADHDGVGGVKVYAVGYWSNPFESYESFYGWPTYIGSIRTDAERANEVIGGKLIVWSPDETQHFPSDYGADQKLFTADDPLQPLAAGYSVVDLDTQPFALDRARQPDVALFEPEDYGVKDFSQLSYRAAFEKLFGYARRQYAFNGIVGKEPDWDALLKQIGPRILAAERDNDPQAFYLAVRDFIWAFGDGHTTIDGGDLADAIEDPLYDGGFGLAFRELDDGRALVTYVLEDGPAAQAGIAVGAELLAFNNTPINDAIAAVVPPNGPYSTERAQRYDQARYLLRTPIDTTGTLTWMNKRQDKQTAQLASVEERDSLRFSSIYRGSDPTAAPVEFWVLESNLGYVRINTNDDDTDLIEDLFLRAMDSFEYNEVEGVIVDMRQNDGGINLGLAGYRTNTSIPLGQLSYFSETTGRFEPDGPVEETYSVDDPYQFELALLVGPACFSACEIEAYGFSQLPGAVVVGHEPTAGVEAEVAQGEFNLPEDISVQIPTGRYTLPDGSLFLEGQGVAPTLRVPLNERTVLSDDDEVLEAAERALAE